MDSTGTGEGVRSGGCLRSGGVRRQGAERFLSAHSAVLYQSLDVSPGSGKMRRLEESAVFQTKKLVTVIVIFVGPLSPTP